MCLRKLFIPGTRHCAYPCVVVLCVLFLCPSSSYSQAVTEIVTNYNGFWRTGTSNVNAVKPDNHHELVSFSYNGNRYSTGVNDNLLATNGLAYTPGQYHALPMTNIAGTANGNTKIGLGAMIDGVYNGAGAAPSRNLAPYLNDGANGLDMGTCVANLPSGTMFLSVSNIQAAKIGDGVPDIVVTQVADPSSSYDSYEFTDINGVRVGSSLNVVLNTISPVGQWMADFYEATGSTVLSAGYTQTARDIRLWAADFTTFGINASNIANVAYFKINLSGTSDIAFVAYNSTTITVQAVLDLQARQRLSRPLTTPAVNTLSVFPNPANNVVDITHPKAKTEDAIFIYNVTGTIILKYQPGTGSTKTKVPVSSLSPGMYMVVYSGSQKRLTQKLIVQ